MDSPFGSSEGMVFTALGFDTEANGVLAFLATRVEERDGRLVPLFDDLTALAVARAYDAACMDTWGRTGDEDAVSRWIESDRTFEFFDLDNHLAWCHRSERTADDLVAFPCWDTWERTDDQPVTAATEIAGKVYGIDIPLDRAEARYHPDVWRFEPAAEIERRAEAEARERANVAERGI